MLKTMNRITAVVVFVIMFLFMTITLIKIGSPKLETRNTDSESTQECSTAEEERFSENIVKYTADNFAFREFWIAAKARLETYVCESIVNDVYISEERLIDTEISKTNPDLAAAGKLNDFAAGFDGAVYLVAVPTSAGVYGDILPSYLRPETEKQQIDRFYRETDSSIRKIDAYNILKMLCDNYIYYRSDYRWTSYGAYCVYRTVIQKLGFQPISYDKYAVRHVSDEYCGTLYERTQYMLSNPDILDVYEYESGAEVTECLGYKDNGIGRRCKLYDTEKINSEEDMYSLYLGGEHSMVRIKTSVNNNRKLLVIGDSFANCFIPFLIQHYSLITFISPQNTDVKLSNFVSPDEYEQVLFIFGIDSLNDSSKFDMLK